MQYMNEYAEEQFLDLIEKEKMNLEAAGELFRQLLQEQGINCDDYQKEQLSEDLIKEFRWRTNWSVRKIAALTGINKDKINRMVCG